MTSDAGVNHLKQTSESQHVKLPVREHRTLQAAQANRTLQNRTVAAS